jgi:hypothetical protein
MTNDGLNTFCTDPVVSIKINRPLSILTGEGGAMRLPRVRFTIRRMMLIVAFTAVVMSYVGSYYRLSRAGMREAARYGIAGFLYVPFEEAADREDLSRHYALMTFYAPLNWLDRILFGAPGPTSGIMWRLSG